VVDGPGPGRDRRPVKRTTCDPPPV